ncbi:RTA1-domain-containing protein [Lojkania enalia]|uniref:RTA1-domain-containing protein n=1 Tax=Lojkania enalia TaxID=147567 RepID=A0A9P4K2U8_9PLEO|nr:RTA1-domain-containing protein [Didymosphaeria enalia]
MVKVHNYYAYSPSIPAAVIAIIVFSILFLLHTFRLLKTKTWFCIPFVVGALFEVGGYGVRAYGHSHPDSKAGYIAQTLLILLAPILFAASVYMFLGRIIRATGFASYSIIRTTWLTKIFVGGDILCFLIQAVGATMLTAAETKDAIDRGKTIVLFGLVLQLFIFGFFVVVGMVFHLRMRKRHENKSVVIGWNWQWYLNMLYVVSVIITLRNLFRVVEFAQGKQGYLMTTEWPIYVFDAILMAIVLAICQSWYVSRILQQHPGRDSQEHVEMMMNASGEPYRQIGA